MAFAFKERLDLDKKTEAAKKLKEHNDSMHNRLVKARQMELSYQRCKESLMKKKKLVEKSIQKRAEEVQDVAMLLPPAAGKLFDQLYADIDEISQLELLLLELNQKLLNAQATREKATILSAIRAASSSDELNIVEVCPMREWFRQIACVKRLVDTDTTALTLQKAGRVHTDRVFYWVKFEESPLGGCGHGGHPTLMFYTRHCGICLWLCITASRRSTDGDPSCCSLDSYKVASDLPLDGLQISLQHSLKQRQMAHDFVIETVWRLMEEQLVPLLKQS